MKLHFQNADCKFNALCTAHLFSCVTWRDQHKSLTYRLQRTLAVQAGPETGTVKEQKTLFSEGIVYTQMWLRDVRYVVLPSVVWCPWFQPLFPLSDLRRKYWIEWQEEIRAGSLYCATVCAYICVYVCMCVIVYVSACVYVYVHICIHILTCMSIS